LVRVGLFVCRALVLVRKIASEEKLDLPML
jgi:hypothetical protein